MHFYRVGPVCVHHVRGNPLAKIRFEAVDAHVQQHCQLVLIPPDRLRIGEIHNGKAGLPHIPLPHVPIRSFQEIPLFCALVKEGGFLPDIGINPDADFDAFFLNPFQHTRRVGKYPLVPDKVLKDMSKGMDDSEEGMPEAMDSADMPQLYVATNDRKINGASVLLYDGVLEGFAEQTGGDFYILPSSIHEALFLPATPDVDENDLPEMVRGVNAGCLEPDEILSDNAYLYHAEDGSVTLVS